MARDDDGKMTRHVRGGRSRLCSGHVGMHERWPFEAHELSQNTAGRRRREMTNLTELRSHALRISSNDGHVPSAATQLRSDVGDVALDAGEGVRADAMHHSRGGCRCTLQG